MFLLVITLLTILYLVAERYIYRSLLLARTRKQRTIYLSISALGLLPYCIITIVGRLTPLTSATASIFGTISLILLIANILCKIPFALGLWARNRKGHKWPIVAAKTFSAIALLLLLYGTLWERNQLRTTELTLYYDNLPEAADGLRIVQIGDLHIGHLPSRHKAIGKMVDRINQLQPDLVIDCGDMINARYTELDSTTMRLLGQIKAPLGVYTIFGNHDRGDYLSRGEEITPEENTKLLRERQAAMGWQNITNSTAVIRIGADSILLTGIDYPKDLGVGTHGVGTEEDYAPHFEGLPDEAFNIVIAHTPSVWSNILAACDAELTLSGHVHAMQIRIPIGPRGWSPAALVYEHWSGLYNKGKNHLFITDGIGGGLPIRIGTKPQIVVITLRRR